MPQTRFVTKKALALGLKPIVVVNKVDKPGANPDKVVNAAFDLFDKLGATDEQLDFPQVYASGINGWTSMEEGPGSSGARTCRLFLKPCSSMCLRTRGTPVLRCNCRFRARLLHLRRADRRGPHQPGHHQAEYGCGRDGRADGKSHSRAASTRC